MPDSHAMRKVHYTIVIERTTRNFSAHVPDLPGCIATGATREEVVRQIREAMEFHIEGMREQGEPIPGPQCIAAVVDVAAG